jgi:hypothetical protein
MRRSLPAPQLRETADIWWDSGTDPVIVWDASGRRFWLVDGAGDPQRLRLVVLDGEEVPPPAEVAGALRDGLAACDFPPTDPGVPAHRAVATLRAAGLQV